MDLRPPLDLERMINMNIRFTLLILILAMASCSASMSPSIPTIITPDRSVIMLDDIGIYSVGYQYRGKQPQSFPVGWYGMFEERTGISCLPFGTQNGMNAFLIHSPWHNGTGTAYQEFSFQMPKVQQVLLQGATAMRSDVIGKSDGTTFRIYANGKKLLDTNQADDKWHPYRLDLSAYMGKTLTIRFETDPGPKNDPSYDYSLWGNRELILKGYKAGVVHSVSPLSLDLRNVASKENGSVIPLSGFSATRSVALKDDTAVFKYAGQEGILEYRWMRPEKTGDPLLGSILLKAAIKNGKQVIVPAGSTSNAGWVGSANLLKSRWSKVSPDSVTCEQTYRIGDILAILTITGSIREKSLVFDVECDKPVISSIDMGSWGPVMRHKPIYAPYYTGQIYYFSIENMFVNTFLDWTNSSATIQDGSRASYLPLTDGSRNLLKERVIYTAAWHMAETLPNIPNPKSPFMKDVGNRIVLDIWGGRYTDIAANLEKLHERGITNCTAIIHAWQRSGYDNGLPTHMPANQALGGDEGMKILVQTAVRLGYLIALHENYVDYYTNYDFYNEDDIALDSAGKKQLAWYNEGTKMQSFAIKPNVELKLAATQSPEIHRRYGTNADYLDVHSAVPPWFHVDQRAGEAGAGMFSQTWDIHKKLWAYERDTHKGPVFGEGAAHWYWSGYLDGVEAQLSWGSVVRDGMKAPLALDFDLLKIHPLQVNHGMGYYERWWSKITWGGQPPMVVLDQYRMQEIAYGHAGFLSGSLWSYIPLVWLEHNLLTPVMASYSTARPVDISYQINGVWKDGSEAAKADAWQRVRIRYDNGLVIYANNSETPMKAGTYDLPQYGWAAEGAGVKAYTAIRDGVVADYAETRDSVFANARDADIWNSSGIKRIHPAVSSFKQESDRTIEFSYAWDVNESLNGNYVCFVHFTNEKVSPGGENISFQQDHGFAISSAQWKPGDKITDGRYTLKLPDSIPDGDYKWFVGLLNTSDNTRLPIEGVGDDHNRALMGILHVSGNGTIITFTQEKSSGSERIALYNRNLNSRHKVVDFGSIRTNGSVMIRRSGDFWELQTLPVDKDFIVELNSSRFALPKSVESIGGSSGTASTIEKDGWRQLNLNGAAKYRWAAK